MTLLGLVGSNETEIKMEPSSTELTSTNTTANHGPVSLQSAVRFASRRVAGGWLVGQGYKPIVKVVNPDFSGKVPHFSAKHKIFLQAVKYAERALFARIQLGRSWARYPGLPRAFFGEPQLPHVVTV